MRNAAFFPAFFLPPVFAAAGAVCLARRGERPSALWFGLGALVYLLGGLILTLVVNVPMNERLAVTAIPDEPAAAEALRRGYADPWLAWNHVRTFFSFVALGCIGAGLAALQARRD